MVTNLKRLRSAMFKKIIPFTVLWLAAQAQALYYFNDVKIRLLNQSNEPQAISVYWAHGSKWFSTEESQPLRWDRVLVSANDGVQSVFSVLVFPDNEHAWSLKVASATGGIWATFSGSNEDLIGTGFGSHSVELVIQPGACQAILKRNGQEEVVNAPDTLTCVGGQYVAYLPSVESS